MSMWRRMAKAGWQRRHKLAMALRSTGNGMLWCYHRLPLPNAARTIVKDGVFLSLDHFILRSETYQRWLRDRGNGRNIHALLGTETSQDTQTLASPPAIPTQEQWKQASKYSQSDGAMIDVVVPVYGDEAATLNCLYHVLTSQNQTAFELVVINDASPENSLVETLHILADDGYFTLLENEENKGFVATANRGMQFHTDRDVVLLNADTEVYGNWLDRLLAHRDKDEHTGTVTPLANNAEIASYPTFVRDNQEQLECEYAALDALAAECNAGESVDTPTAVGCCMLITRQCLEQTGYFDAETFGRGYGEENDFCLRASSKGFSHRIAGDIFIRHLGGTSFAAEKQARMRNAWKAVNKRHPQYKQMVADYLATDPPRRLRRQLDIARIQKTLLPKGTVLMVSHDLGGGTEKHITDMTQRLAEEETSVLLMQPIAKHPHHLRLHHPAIPHTPNLIFHMEHEREALIDTLRASGVTHIHVHHVIGFAAAMTDYLTLLAETLSCHYDITIHDYYSVSPSINLTGYNGRFCEDPQQMRPATSQVNNVAVWQWQYAFARFFRQARHVYVPGTDVLQRMIRHFPEQSFMLRPHPEPEPESAEKIPSLHRPRNEQEPLRVAIIGAIPEIKGAKILEKLVQDANRRTLPIDYLLIGHTTYPPLAAGMERLTITGKYEEGELTSLLTRQAPHLVLIPTIVPETYCYTLSHAFQHDIWPVVFDLGSQAQRIRDSGYGSIVPLEWAEQPEKLSDFLLKLTVPEERTPPLPAEYPSLLEDYYGL